MDTLIKTSEVLGIMAFEVAGVDASNAVFNTVSESSADMGTSVGDAAGDAASGIFEEGGWVLIGPLLLAIVFGTGLYLVYDAPFILSEAAFEPPRLRVRDGSGSFNRIGQAANEEFSLSSRFLICPSQA